MAVRCAADGINFHLDHQYENEPELLLNLLGNGPIEQGRDASYGGVEFYNLAAADSFAAIEQRIDVERRLNWPRLEQALKNDFSGREGFRIGRLSACGLGTNFEIRISQSCSFCTGFRR